MDTDQLAAFDRIARHGSFSRAALALGIGQPAISARIRNLEDSVGGALFSRGRRVALTALGESFLPYARRVLDVLREGVDSAQSAQVGGRGHVKLGTLGSLAGGLVGPALARFMRSHPEVPCTLRSADHETLLQMLYDGLIDLALVAWPAAELAAAELSPIFLYEEPVVLVAHPEHPLARKRTVSQAEVARLARPLIRLRWWPQHDPRITALADRSGAFAELPMETARHLVLHGTGAGFFVRTFIAADLAEGALVSIAVRGLAPSRTSALVRRRRSPLSPAAAALIECLRVQAQRR